VKTDPKTIKKISYTVEQHSFNLGKVFQIG
jgi:hypothetical protein